MKWIKVEDELSSKDAPVLVYRKDWSIEICEYVSFSSGEYWYEIQEFIPRYDITHWMALPPKPNEV